jgi:hypothetical protein
MENSMEAPQKTKSKPSNGGSGGRDQDHGLKTALANSSVRPYLKKTLTKNDWWSSLRCRP